MTVADLFDQPLKVINVGLRSFAEDLKTLMVDVEHVDTESSSESAAPGSSRTLENGREMDQ
jgi:hypothetical protein